MTNSHRSHALPKYTNIYDTVYTYVDCKKPPMSWKIHQWVEKATNEFKKAINEFEKATYEFEKATNEFEKVINENVYINKTT